jgi:hypothetical protein
MENEPQQITTYDLPDVAQVEWMEPSEAQRALDRMNDQVLAAGGSHPYQDANHQRHEGWMEYSRKLYAHAATARPDPMQQMLDEVEAAKQEKQAARIDEAESVLEELRGLNFDGDNIEVSGDIEQYEIESWKRQAQLAKGEFSQVAEKVKRDVRRLRAPSRVEADLDFALSLDENIVDEKGHNLREMRMTNALAWIRDAEKKQIKEADRILAEVKARREKENG